MSNYTSTVTTSQTRFTSAPMAELEFSTVLSNPQTLTTFNGGDIVPIYCAEVLPHDTFSVDLDFVIRQATPMVPVMGQLFCDVYAFFVPNRVVNKSWKNVLGENSSGAWTAPEVSLAPLYPTSSSTVSVQVPVGSVADYYGFPTQRPIPTVHLKQCHDLKFRGYLEIYNNYFRSQSYQPPIPYSKLNVYNGFFAPVNSSISAYNIATGTKSDGSYPYGAYQKELGGDGSVSTSTGTIPARKTSWSALSYPLKANKKLDYFTSCLPTPQRGREVSVSVKGPGFIPLDTSDTVSYFSSNPSNNSAKLLRFAGLNRVSNTSFVQGATGKTYNLGYQLSANHNNSGNKEYNTGFVVASYKETDVTSSIDSLAKVGINGSNAGVTLNDTDFAVSIDALRMSACTQQLYELLGRGGSRYIEYINSFFGLEIDNPFDDIPTLLGHYNRDLDMFQTAQTSGSSVDEANPTTTPQGTLAAFGYTNKGGSLFTKTFLEHGYVHIFAVVRHRNVYASTLARDNFRLSMLDFYNPIYANISEQPVYTREINPFLSTTDDVVGYQEPWYEYRVEPDRVTGYMRTGVDLSLANWNLADDFDGDFTYVNGEWLKSNTAEIVRRSTAVQDRSLPQFKGQFMFSIKKERPMPVYSVPGIDIF